MTPTEKSPTGIGTELSDELVEGATSQHLDKCDDLHPDAQCRQQTVIDSLKKTSQDFAGRDALSKRAEHHFVGDYDIGYFAGRIDEIDDFTRYSILENHWKPPKGFSFPFSIHNKQGGQEKRYVNQSHLDKYPWLVFSRSTSGLFCKFCPLFVPGNAGGLNRSIPLQQLVTRPLKSFAKLLGKTGDLEKHSHSQYHIDAVLSASDFLKNYRNPGLNIASQVNSQRAAQVSEN